MTHTLDSLPAGPLPGTVLVLEATPGAERSRRLASWLSGFPAARPVVSLDCDAARGGLWAGLAQWLRELLPALEERAPHLIERHSHEIVTVLPAMRRRIRSTKTSLTDEAPSHEAVRNYAIDRGYRVGQGCIDLLAAWREISGDENLVVVCHDFDRAGALVKRFFGELVRRRSEALGLSLVAVVSPGNGDDAAERLDDGRGAQRIAWELPEDPAPRPDPVESRRRALALEERVARDPLEIEIRLPELIRTWSASDRPLRALSWQAFALGLYNHHGFYEDGFQYVEPVLANLDAITPIAGFEFFFTRWNLVGSLFGSLVANGEARRAQQVVEEEGLAKITDDEERVRVNYVMAMLHARFLPDTDLERAERHLDVGLSILADSAAIAAREKVFLGVFLENGLAFVRHRQKRPQEAIDLCREGFERMNRHWQSHEHRLHRSVLLYNQAQVYAGLGSHAEAVEKFSQALEMDPNYSEYYNERGCVYLAMGRHQEAIEDFQRAIETSPPYPEVWTNLGQCYRRMGQLEEAANAFSRALDLDPKALLARVGRAQALNDLGRAEAAERDYDQALALDDDDPLLWANRAVLRFQRGAVEASVEDLDAAIRLAPTMADLYQNRAVALESAGRVEHAHDDLRTYLRMAPDAPDRVEIEGRLAPATA